MKNEIVLYRPNELAEHIEVRFDEDTVWLNRQQIAMLFGRDVKTIGKHIGNVFSESELEREVVVAKFATTTQHGAIKGKTQTTNVEHYYLDVIIFVGYRVKPKQGTQFRIWATKKLKDYLLIGYAINTRMNRIEDNVEALGDALPRRFCPNGFPLCLLPRRPQTETHRPKKFLPLSRDSAILKAVLKARCKDDSLV